MNIFRPLFPRPALVEALIGDLAGESLADYRSGLFLASARGTGKTTFIKNEFIARCRDRSWLPVYVDLEATRHLDPAVCLADAIGRALGAFAAPVRSVHTSNPAHAPQPPSVPTTVAQLLEALHRVSRQRLVLIIDEAHYVLHSANGMSLMFALKAARDHLNLHRDADGLRLVFTGSSHDKLTQLLNTAKQPFYGAHLTPFPLLDDDYIAFITETCNRRLALSNQFSRTEVAEAFAWVGHRPALLHSVMAEAAVGLGQASHLGALLQRGDLDHLPGAWSDYERRFQALSPLQQAVLRVLAKKTFSRQAFAPFSEQTLEEVTSQLLVHGSAAKASAPGLQKALAALRHKDLLWRNSVGQYALEDAAMAEWLLKQPRPD
ncbi:hypothetical protein ACS77_02190 [Pseudomonas syringae]|uniref:ORC1/DEAH AAA+ ATPase domain-containing protein n=1 Tax=Pseudomonas syringae TaxID=317 RepID=A0A0L1MM79_PSESX|nr:hypothetical protein ACS77_02190 [Pseudomonas syringae]